MKYTPIHSAVIIIVALIFSAGAETDELSDLKRRLAIVEQRLDRIEQRLDRHCTDEFEQAFAYTTGDGAITDTAVPALWDGTPFVVDVSSTFPNAYELLDVVAFEAEKVREVLGYEVFVAGQVLSLADLQKSDLSFGVRGSHIPPDQHIEVRCCYGEGITAAGTAAPLRRIILLENDVFHSRHIIIHELYHLLGFTHPGDSLGVVMSDSLMHGPGLAASGAAIRTQPSPLDLARLSCIYSTAEMMYESYDELTTGTTFTSEINDEPCQKNNTGQLTVYLTNTTQSVVDIYINGRHTGSLHAHFLFGGPDCGAPTDDSVITETVRAGDTAFYAVGPSGTWEPGTIDVEVCGCETLILE